jgi:16S rRNA processing protein RimM
MRIEQIVEDDRIFEPGRNVRVLRDSVEQNLVIEFFRKQHGRSIIKFYGVDTIDGAEKLVGADVRILEKELPPLEEGSFYTFHLKGCTVTANGIPVGVVVDVMVGGGTEILRIEGEDGEVLIPFAEPFLKKIDLEQRRIEVDLPDELRDLNK